MNWVFPFFTIRKFSWIESIFLSSGVSLGVGGKALGNRLRAKTFVPLVPTLPHPIFIVVWVPFIDSQFWWSVGTYWRFKFSTENENFVTSSSFIHKIVMNESVWGTTSQQSTFNHFVKMSLPTISTPDSAPLHNFSETREKILFWVLEFMIESNF